ncbi:MAG: L-threonine 3-dehydrogenase [Candidatus Nanoarchaeia archaeon]
MKKILVIGAAGQIGTELTIALRKKYGNENVIAGIRKTRPNEEVRAGPVETVDATSKQDIEKVVKTYNIDTIFHLASLLSAAGERNPELAWSTNMLSLKNVLDLAKELKLKVFWPSSIAAFGPDTPKTNTPNETIMNPNTMYGITKVAGELLCNYYFEKFGVDVRSLRYPGIISYKTLPGGGTTDYAVEIFYEALQKGRYTCFLKSDAILPMMYMPDAIKATIDLMEADSSKIKIRTSYNLAAISFSPEDIYREIKRHIPAFKITYVPDFRQKIADSWPKSIDDSKARQDWGWKHEYDLPKITEDMLEKLRAKLR